LVVVHGSAAAGQGAAQLPLAGAKIVAVLRGAMLLPAPESLPLKPGDIVLLLGTNAEVKEAAGLFTKRQKAMA
jgi:Trk K+ transport system NAD-binding subunit